MKIYNDRLNAIAGGLIVATILVIGKGTLAQLIMGSCTLTSGIILFAISISFKNTDDK